MKRVKTACPDSDTGQRSCQNVPRAVRRELASPVQDELPEASNMSFHSHYRDDLRKHGKENIGPSHHLEGHLDEAPDSIHQEDGYMSPSPPYFRLTTPDLSSPTRHPFGAAPRKHGSTDDFGADIMSSPLAIKRRSHRRSESPCELKESGRIFVRGTPPPFETDIDGPDLRDILSICSADEVEELGDHETSAAITPSHSEPGRVSRGAMMSEGLGPDTSASEMRMHAVANGWWNKWAMKQGPHPAHVSNLVVDPSDTEFSQKLPMLRRLETTVTPDGRQSGQQSRPWSAPPNATGPHVCHATTNSRKILNISWKPQA